MNKSRVLRVLFGVCSLILLAAGMFIYVQNHQKITLYSTMCWRSAFMLFFFWCFWERISRLPRWTYIGWLPLAAAVIAWRPFLLKFAVPASVLLVFLNSPFARGTYRPKSWRNFHFDFQNSGKKQARSSAESSESVKTAESKNSRRESVPESRAESVPEKVSDRSHGPVIEILPASGFCGEKNTDWKDTEKEEEKEKEEKEKEKEKTKNSEPEENKNKEYGKEKTAERKECTERKEDAERKKSEKTKTSDVRGPQAKNVMFRALSRVAGRQVGKIVNKKKK